MNRLIFWKAVILTAVIFATPSVAIAQHSCDQAYRSNLHYCERDHAQSCNQARHNARSVCSRHQGRRCEEYRMASDQKCRKHSGCRQQAEYAYHACRRDQHHYRR